MDTVAVSQPGIQQTLRPTPWIRLVYHAMWLFTQHTQLMLGAH